MSKSKKNVVAPEAIIDAFGADTIRWFMLSDLPPERDVKWTQEGAEGCWRFVQRLWRLVNESAEIAEVGAGRPAGRVRRRRARRCARPPMARWTRCRTASSGCVSTSASPISANSPMRWPRCWRTRRQAGAPTSAWAVREAVDHPGSTVRADDAASGRGVLGRCWASKALVSEADWPQIERDLLVEDTVTLAVQVNGKKRGDVTVPRGAQNPEIEAAVLALDAVKLALGRQGRPRR